jgi:hypothetical protein
MFNITGLGPAFDYYVMNSDEVADKIIETFADYIARGYHPNDVEWAVYQDAGVNPGDLTDYDKRRIQTRVSEIWEQQGAKY